MAHNTLSNYYRDTAKAANAVPIDEVPEQPSVLENSAEGNEADAAVCRLQAEIAYLSKLQRRIVVAYYFENRKQADIAQELGIPLGTVKWHLFEAKKELKRGVTMTRNYGELKFNPIQLTRICCNGSPGTKGSNANFFRSALSQNIGLASVFPLKSHRLTHAVAPPFRKKSRSAHRLAVATNFLRVQVHIRILQEHIFRYLLTPFRFDLE